jgi:hypothetical protein
MRSRMAFFGAAFVATLALAVPIQDSRQDETKKKIDDLVRALDVQKKKTANLELRVERIENWFAAVRAACDVLDGAANEARRNGFEQAGPNALAHTNVLEGLKAFAAELTRTAPAPIR